MLVHPTPAVPGRDHPASPAFAGCHWGEGQAAACGPRQQWRCPNHRGQFSILPTTTTTTRVEMYFTVTPLHRLLHRAAVPQVTGAALLPPSLPPLTSRRHQAPLPATASPPSPIPPPADVAARGGGGRAGGRADLAPPTLPVFVAVVVVSPLPTTPRKVSNRPPPAEGRGAAAVGRPALTAAGPGASTAPSGDLYMRSIIYVRGGQGRSWGLERQNGLCPRAEERRAGLKGRKAAGAPQPLQHWGGPRVPARPHLRAGAAGRGARKPGVSPLRPPKISPLQICETAQFKKMGFFFLKNLPKSKAPT